MKPLTFVLIAVIVIMLILLIGHQKSLHWQDDQYEVASYPIDAMLEPKQVAIEEEEVVREMSYKGEDYKIVISPLYYYEISGKVVSVRKWRKWEESDFPIWKEIFPIDFGLVWGKLTDEKYAQYVKFSHRPASRFLHWRYKFPTEGPSLSEEYMSKHFSNNHLSPANETIKYALHKVKKGDLVRIEGWLMEMDLYKSGQKISSARSSTTREDVWGGACESIYVKKIQINDKIYE